ncbi:MAG: hypothetical protein AB7P01_19340 [Bacteroidia bacterium]
MAQIRAKLNYRQMKLELLEAFALLVLAGIYNNVAIFMAPPLMQAAFAAIVNDYVNKLALYQARSLSKADFDLSKTALINALDTLRVYVDSVALGDPIIISLGGYEPTKGSNSNSNAPVQPTGVTFAKGITGQFITECNLIPGATNYTAALVADNPIPDNVSMNGLGQLVEMNDDTEPVTGGSAASSVPGIKYIVDFNKSRKKTFTGLTIGTTYYLYYWASNAGGVSPMSDVVSKKMVEW